MAWKAIREGRSGIAEPTLFDPGDLPITVVGEVPDFDPTAVASAKEARRLDRNVLLAMTAAKEAVDDADLVGLRPRAHRRARRLGDRRLPHDPRAARHHARARLGRGSRRTSSPRRSSTPRAARSRRCSTCRARTTRPCSACATGAHAIGEAAELLRRGGADAVVAGGVEACLHPLLLAGFTTMKGLGTARPGERSETASRPFDATRNGFVCSEGSTVVVLEPLDARRRARRAHPRRGDRARQLERRLPRRRAAPRVARPDPDDEPRRSSRPGIAPEEVGYINAHGTSTPQGDAAETFAIKTIFGDHAYELAVSSTKSATGHQFGAAGRVRDRDVRARAAATASCRRRCNYRDPDPECDLDYVTEGAREIDVGSRCRTRSGLGGHNGCVLVRRYERLGARRRRRTRRPCPARARAAARRAVPASARRPAVRSIASASLQQHDLRLAGRVRRAGRRALPGVLLTSTDRFIGRRTSVGSRRQRGDSGPDLAGAVHDVLRRRDVGEPDRARARAAATSSCDLGAEPELAAVGEARRGVDVHAGRADAADERVGRAEMLSVTIASEWPVSSVSMWSIASSTESTVRTASTRSRYSVAQSSSVGRQARRAERLGGVRVGAQLDAGVAQRRRRSGEQRQRVAVHEQRLGGVAHAGPLRLRVDDDRAAPSAGRPSACR